MFWVRFCMKQIVDPELTSVTVVKLTMTHVKEVLRTSYVKIAPEMLAVGTKVPFTCSIWKYLYPLKSVKKLLAYGMSQVGLNVITELL